MRKPAVPEGPDDDAGIDLTPMLDVVFIMLVFFIVTASFIRETGLELAGTDTSVEPSPQAGAILIRIDAGDALLVNDRPVQGQALRAYIAGLHLLARDQPVVIQPHRESSAQALVTALDTVNANGISDVSVSAAPDW